jgi:LuxR family transcriptional regulator, maltose regulon positive regulatory protein
VTSGSRSAAIGAGREALSRGAWEKARVSFEAALREGETPAALEGLSWALWWLYDTDAMFATRELVFRRYRQHGDARGAARMAIWLAADYLDVRGEVAISNGWRERARRILGALDDTSEHGWLALLDGTIALEMDHDPAAARAYGARATELGLRFDLVDLEMLGLAVEGLALVTQGEVPAGMRRLDEAVTAAVAGELEDVVSIMLASCYVIYACERVRDYDREAQWCHRVEELAARLQIRQLLGECRTHYGGVLTWNGAWPEAERQLGRATDDFASSRPLAVADSTARLAELRRRQGRLDEAERLLDSIEGHPRAALARAHLVLDRGDVEQAADLAQRRLRNLPPQERTGRADWLEVLAGALATLGRNTEAATVAAELQAIAEAVRTDALRAAASFTNGVVTAAAGDHDSARLLLEDSVERYVQCGGPFEAARSRLALAQSLHALGRRDTAIEEAQRAGRAFADLGAELEATRAESLLSDLKEQPGDRAGADAGRPHLTTRQRDVLRMVADGLSDRQIAHRLAISEHTVHRHIANILTRFEVPSRAAAVARAKDFELI